MVQVDRRDCGLRIALVERLENGRMLAHGGDDPVGRDRPVVLDDRDPVAIDLIGRQRQGDAEPCRKRVVQRKIGQGRAPRQTWRQSPFGLLDQRETDGAQVGERQPGPRRDKPPRAFGAGPCRRG